MRLQCRADKSYLQILVIRYKISILSHHCVDKRKELVGQSTKIVSTLWANVTVNKCWLASTPLVDSHQRPVQDWDMCSGPGRGLKSLHGSRPRSGVTFKFWSWPGPGVGIFCLVPARVPGHPCLVPACPSPLGIQEVSDVEHAWFPMG